MDIRPAIDADLPVLLKLGESKQAEAGRAFDSVRTASRFREMLAKADRGDARVAVAVTEAGEVVGMSACELTAYFFSEEGKVCNDVATYAMREHRSEALRLLAAGIEQWATDQGAAEVYMHMDLQGPKSEYEAMGYTDPIYMLAKSARDGSHN